LRDDSGDCKQFLQRRASLGLSACSDEQKIFVFSSKCLSAEGGISAFILWTEKVGQEKIPGQEKTSEAFSDLKRFLGAFSWNLTPFPGTSAFDTRNT
jgi:hypothetical protein